MARVVVSFTVNSTYSPADAVILYKYCNKHFSDKQATEFLISTMCGSLFHHVSSTKYTKT